MKVIGINIVKYIGTLEDGTHKELEKYFVYCVYKYTMLEIELYTVFKYGGTVALYEIRESKGQRMYSHIPISESNSEIPDSIWENYSNRLTIDHLINKVFVYSRYGNDHYSPKGYIKLVLTNFLFHGKEKRPVWIFTGPPESGKSFLCSKLKGLKIIDTDEIDWEKCQFITADVIILGTVNQEITIDLVKEKIFGDAEVIVVKFGSS